MKQYFSELYTGGKSLVEGLGVTMKALFQPIVTVQYPREEIDITPNFRGHIDLILDPKKNTYLCIIRLGHIEGHPCSMVTGFRSGCSK